MKTLSPTIAPVSASVLEAEVQALPPESLLVDGGEMATYIASAGQIPSVLREIGRLREVTFRATGEGTGRELDLDRFDERYEHLFIWHRKAKDIVGAYRICYCDRILERDGIKGLYTHTLFKIRQRPLRKLGPTIELGRSFVREEYQRSFTPLMLLWKGIGALVCRKPEYCCLLGPVSISNTYQTLSRRLMVDFLKCQYGPEELKKLARPRNPFPESADAPMELRFASQDAQAISDLITDLEEDGKGMPVLLRQYLKLGARALAFNVDPDFSDVLDALLVIDLRKTDPRILDRYMGKDARQTFHAYHHVKAQPAVK
jgi:putative hemolysin